MVPTAGLEPARLSPLPPQDSVSTNSTTSANLFDCLFNSRPYNLEAKLCLAPGFKIKLGLNPYLFSGYFSCVFGVSNVFGITAVLFAFFTGTAFTVFTVFAVTGTVAVVDGKPNKS
jgi:hypothetical protein